MQRITNGNTIPATTTGPVCAINVGGAAGLAVGSPTSPLNFISRSTFYAFGNTGLTSVTLQAQVLNEDGTWRDYGPSITGTGPGYIAAFVILGPILGARWNITAAVTGGSIYASCAGMIE